MLAAGLLWGLLSAEVWVVVQLEQVWGGQEQEQVWALGSRSLSSSDCSLQQSRTLQ